VLENFSGGVAHREEDLIERALFVILIDGPLAPFGDADQLRTLINRDDEHRALYQVFLAVRDAAAKILEHTTLADIMNGKAADASKSGKRRKKKSESSSVLPMVVHGNPGRGKDE